jgi:hypothetical protein
VRIQHVKTATVAAVAVGGMVVGLSLPAAAREAKQVISGSSIKKGSIPGNRLKAHGVTAKQIQPLKWHKLTLRHGWVTGDKGLEGSPAYAIDAQGVVHLTGSLDGEGSSSTTAFVMPKAARPHHDQYLAIDSSNASTSRIDILLNGAATVEIDPDHTGDAIVFDSLDGVTYWPGH